MDTFLYQLIQIPRCFPKIAESVQVNYLCTWQLCSRVRRTLACLVFLLFGFAVRKVNLFSVVVLILNHILNQEAEEQHIVECVEVTMT